MSKYKIKTQKAINGDYFFAVYRDGNTTAFPTFEGALNSVARRILRDRKEASAFGMVCNTSINLLSIHERQLIEKLQKTKCLGITQRQYGFLKGIYDRQQKAW